MNREQEYEAFKVMLRHLPMELQQHIYFYALNRLSERNKDNLNELIAKRIHFIYEPRTERKAWRKWGTECVHYIEFYKNDRNNDNSDSSDSSGDEDNNYDNDFLSYSHHKFPFCTAFLHTEKKSYLFAKTEPYPVVKFKTETIYLERIFPNLQKLPLIEPYWTKDTIESMGGIAMHALCIGGTLAYSFRSLSTEEELARRMNNHSCTIL